MSDFAKRIIVSTCMMFTLFMTIGSIAVIIFTGPQYGLVMTLSFLIASLLFAILRGIWFTDKIIHRLAYPARIAGFGVTGLIALAACAWVGNWFPADNIWAWMSFGAIYLVILVGFCIGYQIYFKRTVGNFDNSLRKYHEKMGR